MEKYKQLPLTERATRRVISTRRPNGSVKTREIWEPSDELRDEHHRMLEEIQGLDIPMPHAFGGTKGVSIYDNVAAHRGSQDFYLLDLKDAYQSVDRERLIWTIRHAVGRRAVRASQLDGIDNFIRNSATIEGVPGLPLGFPASPFLCNIYFAPMDAGLHYNLNGNLSPEDPEFVTITRWIDDITLSAKELPPKRTGEEPRTIFSESKRRMIRDIIHQNGGEINHGKARLHSLGRGAVTITGMSLYPDGRIAPSPRLMEQVTAHLERALEKFAKGELTWADIDDLNGQKSILHMTKDGSPASSGQRSVRELAKKYAAFIEEAAASLGSRNML